MHGFYDSSNCDIASYSNDNTSSASSNNCNLEAVIDSLEESTDNLFQWFINNYMTNNCWQMPSSGYWWLGNFVNIKEFEIKNSMKEFQLLFFQLTLDFLLSNMLHLSVNKPPKICMCLQE